MILANRCAAIRACIIQMSRGVALPHIAPSLSLVEILATVYGRLVDIDAIRTARPERDRIILSKGHAAMALYAALAEFGVIEPDLLASYGRDLGPLPTHPQAGSLPGIETSSGSLGHGLAIGTGAALASRVLERSYRVYVVLGDGECQEGAVWETAVVAAQLRLSDLIAMVDCNGLQSKARTSDVDGSDLQAKWTAFGWDAISVDGHSIDALENALRAPRSKPLAVLARTIKGKGVSFMEERVEWHNRALTHDELELALHELGRRS